MRPFLLLDIDGVISPLGQVDLEKSLVFNNGWATFRVPHHFIFFLKALEDRVDFICSSTWEDDAAPLFQAMGIDVKSYIYFESYSGYQWHKTAGLKAFIAENEGRDFIILDDEFDEEFLAWASSTPNVHALQIDGDLGLSRKNCLAIANILKTYGSKL